MTLVLTSTEGGVGLYRPGQGCTYDLLGEKGEQLYASRNFIITDFTGWFIYTKEDTPLVSIDMKSVRRGQVLKSETGPGEYLVTLVDQTRGVVVVSETISTHYNDVVDSNSVLL